MTRARRAAGGKVMPFVLSSSAFADRGAILAVCTAEGADASPLLEWAGAPAGR